MCIDARLYKYGQVRQLLATRFFGIVQTCAAQPNKGRAVCLIGGVGLLLSSR